jgi:sigma-E factor negative regulatory protein RseC
MNAMTPQPEGGEPRTLVEGTARVVAADAAVVWLEPEQNTSCASCHASAVCGVEPGSRRLVARRFTLANDQGLHVGERVVIGIPEDTLRRASLTAYGLPLAVMLAAGLTAQGAGGGDGGAALASLAGLVGGLLLVRWRERRLVARGELQPRLLRRSAAAAGNCPHGGA